jgi:heme-degrading monooxygenase HmoA
MIATIIEHELLPGKLEQAEALFAANTVHIVKMPGLVGRHVLKSKKDPLKWVTVTIWESQEAAQAWQEHPDHVWDVFNGRRRIPPGTEYFKKYGTATCVDARAATGETFDVISASPGPGLQR